MKKIVSLAAFTFMIAVFSAFFTACDSLKKYLPSKERQNPALNTKIEISLGENEEIFSLEGNYRTALENEKTLVIKNTIDNTYCLYNIEKQSYAGAKSYTKIEYFSNGIFLASKGTNGNKCGLLSAAGEELTGFDYYNNNNYTDFAKSADGKIIRVSYKYFKIENKTITGIGDIRNLSFGIDSVSEKMLHLYGDFLYAYEGSDISKGVSWLNAYTLWGASLKNFEDEGTDTKYFILNDGNILIKKDLVMPSDSKNYTYIDAMGNKCSVKYKIFNLKTGSIKSVKFDYYIEEALGYDNLSEKDKEFISSDVLILNRIAAYEIKEKRLVKTDFYKKGLFADNSLEIKADIGLYEIYKLSDNRFLFVSLLEGQNSFIKDRKGEIIFIIGVNYKICSSYPNFEPAYSGENIVLYNKITGKYGAIDKEGEPIGNKNDEIFRYDSLTLFYGGKAFGTISNGEMAGNYIVSSDGNVVKIDNLLVINNSFFYVTSSNDIYSPNGTWLFNLDFQAPSVYKMIDGTYFFDFTDKNLNKVYFYIK